LSRSSFRKAERGKDVLAPPAGSQPLPRWARGPLSVPCKPGTPTYTLKSKTRNNTYCHMPRSSGPCLAAREGSSAATCSVASDPASMLGRVPVLSCVPWLWTLPPCLEGLQRCHVPCGFGSCLPAQEGSGAATCPATSDPASLLGRAPTLPCVPRLSMGHMP
jgi:hypothetical protein